jgi:ribosomal-protein-alanine N-acetyltransferase
MELKREKILGERIFLKPFEQKDAEAYSKIGERKINTLIETKKFINSSWKKNSYYFGIFLKENKELIGQMELCHMNWWDDEAGEICYFIEDKFRGRGFATEASRTMINFCFRKLKFRKIYADTDPDNLASQKVLKKLGFKLEGKIREKHFVKGKWIDEYDFGLLKTEWKN